MKIGEPPRPTRAAAVDKPRAAQPAAGARATAPVDDLSLLGVPEAELTPRVRAALIGLADDIRALRDELANARARIDELETLADRDPMLDVLNRRAFARELDRALAMIDRYQLRASLVFVDLDNLKQINDERGHAAGDAALGHVAAILTENVRQTDVVARLGGDEFALLLLQADEAVAGAKAGAVAQRVAQTPVAWDGAPFSASVSWGAVELMKGVSAQEAMNRADEAMYEAKKMK